jgi:methylated-DNA-[protein]-cysteine S-methyltransferase
VFRETRSWLDGYFAGKKPSAFALPPAPFGSAFRQEVWRILRAIPYGEILTYGGIAKMAAEKMGRARMSAQAVGGAVGHNPISIIIPCHRVVGANGSLTGYAGGLETKLRLLELEGVATSSLFIPKNGTAL